MKKLALVLAMLLMCTLVITSCGSADGTASDSNIAVEFVAGNIENGVYTNDSLGIVFTPSANLTMMTQEEINAALNAGSDILDADVEVSTNVTYEMMVADNTTGASVQIIAEKLPAPMTASEYVAAAKTGVEQTLGDVEIEETTAELAGSTWNVLQYSMDVQGLNFTTTQYVRTMGDVAVIIGFGDMGTGIDDLIACFSAK